MNRWLLFGLTLCLYLLHQDIWFWRQIRPLAFGFLPIGLAYHLLYAVVVAGWMWVLVRYAWPSHIDRKDGEP